VTRAALVVFIVGLLALFLGLYGVATLSFEVGRMMLVVFLTLGLVSLVASVITDRGPPAPPRS
jgi:uncharacterized membrane protein YtjA (UPF0391 family)